MKITNRKTTTYETEEKGYFVDFCETKYGTEVYLYNERYGIKMLMFGVESKTEVTELEKMVENLLEGYIEQYKEDYED